MHAKPCAAAHHHHVAVVALCDIAPRHKSDNDDANADRVAGAPPKHVESPSRKEQIITGIFARSCEGRLRYTVIKYGEAAKKGVVMKKVHVEARANATLSPVSGGIAFRRKPRAPLSVRVGCAEPRNSATQM